MSAKLVRRELRARPGRVFLVFLTVATAVAFTSGAFGFSEQLGRLLAPADASADALALPQGSVIITARTDGLATSTSLDDALLAKVRDVAGVGTAEGTYDQPVAFDIRFPQPERPGPLKGVVLSSTYDPARWTLVAGRAPSGEHEVVLDAAALSVSQTQLGDQARLQVPIGTVDVAVVGIVRSASSSGGGAAANPAATSPAGADSGLPDAGPGAGESGAAAGHRARATLRIEHCRRQPTRSRTRPPVALTSAHAVMDPAAAPTLLDAVGRADRITVTPRSGVDPDTLSDRLRSALPDSVRLDAATSPSAATQHTVSSIEDSVRLATLIYAGITLLVSVLVVVNVLSVIVAQRTRELGLLRAIGAKRAALVRVVLSEALLIGLAASVVGGAVGVVLAYLGARLVRVVGVRVGFTLTPSMVVASLVVGLAVTAVGGLWPALRAGRVTPLDALSDTRAGADRPTRARVPLVCFVAGFGLAAWAARSSGGITFRSGVLVGLGLVSGFVGLALLSRWIVVPMAGLARRLVGWASISARLGVGNARRQPSRTAGAASTLMVGLALVAVVATVGASGRRTIDQQVSAAGRADLYIERQGLVRVSPTALEGYLEGGRHVGAIRDVAEIIAVDGSVSGPAGDRDPGGGRRSRAGRSGHRPGCDPR